MHLAGDAGREVGQQIEARAADLPDADVPAQRRVQLVPLEDVAEVADAGGGQRLRSEEHTSELQSLMRISYAVFCLTNKIISLLHTQHLIYIVFYTNIFIFY